MNQEILASLEGPIKLVSIQGTSLCNLNCSYCYLSEEERSKSNVLSTETAKMIFKELATTPYVTDEKVGILWHSGEPLAVSIDYYEKMFALLSDTLKEHQAQERQFFHIFQTNGTMINQAWCELIKKHDIEIGVSIDGPAFIHDAQRLDKNKNASHHRVMRGIHLLQENQIKFGIICVLTRNSLSYPDEIFNFFKENKIRDLCFNIEEQEGYNTSSSLANYEDEFRQYMKRFWELTQTEEEKPKVREFRSVTDSILRIEALLEKPDLEMIYTNQLTIPYMTLNIDNQGNFSTFSPELLTIKSPLYGDFVLGNFRTDTLVSALHSSKFKKINDDIQAGVEQCRQKCAYFDYCLGGKPSNKYHENGTFNSTETRECRLRTITLFHIVLDDLEEQQNSLINYHIERDHNDRNQT